MAKTILSALAGTLTLFLMGAIWYGVIFQSFYETHAFESYRKNDDSVLWILACGLFVVSLVMSINFPKWLNNNLSFINGFKAGAWIGVLAGLG